MELTYDYRDAIDQHRCFIFHCPRVDEWANYGRKHSCKEMLRWLRAAPDIKVNTEQVTSMNGVPKIALIFEDPIYAKLFSLHFNAPLEKPSRQ